MDKSVLFVLIVVHIAELKEIEDIYNSQKMEFLKDPNEWFNKNKVSSKLHFIFQDYHKNIDESGFPRHETKLVKRSDIDQFVGVDSEWDEIHDCVAIYKNSQFIGFAELVPTEMYYELISIQVNDPTYLEILFYDLRKIAPVHCMETLDSKIIALFLGQPDLRPLDLMLPWHGDYFSNNVKHPTIGTCL